MKKITTLTLAIAALLTGQAQAAFTLTDGAMSYSQTNSTIGSSNLTVNAGADNLFADRWYYRLSGDTKETILSTITSTSAVSSNMMSVELTSPSASFTANLDYDLLELGTGIGRIREVMSIGNTTAADLIIDLFYYADLDVAGSSSGDTGTMPALNRILFTEGAAAFTAIGASATAWKADACCGLTLTDTAVTNFDNSTVPLGPMDVAAGFQWSLTIPANSSASVTGYMGIGDFTEQQAAGGSVPEPTAMLLLGSALAGFSLFKRRKLQA